MKKILSLFVVLMLAITVVPAIFAQNTTDETTDTAVVDQAGIQEVTTEVPEVTAEVENETTEPVETLPSNISEEDVTAEVTEPVSEVVSEETEDEAEDTTTVQVGKEYTGLEQALDRIRLAFTFQEERKVALMNKIEQKREQHYSFLVAKGKTKQAEKFNSKTIGLVKNFEQWKANKAEKVAKMETKASRADKSAKSAKTETATAKGKGKAKVSSEIEVEDESEDQPEVESEDETEVEVEDEPETEVENETESD